jgi:hypothetical protein
MEIKNLQAVEFLKKKCKRQYLVFCPFWSLVFFAAQFAAAKKAAL